MHFHFPEFTNFSKTKQNFRLYKKKEKKKKMNKDTKNIALLSAKGLKQTSIRTKSYRFICRKK